MPKIWSRSELEISALAREIRAERQFKLAGVVPWLRANTDLMGDLRDGRWKPSEGSLVPVRGRWSYADIARALTEAGVVFKSGRLTAQVLSSRLFDLKRETQATGRQGLKLALPVPQFCDVKRAVLEALDEHGIIGGDHRAGVAKALAFQSAETVSRFRPSQTQCAEVPGGTSKEISQQGTVTEAQRRLAEVYNMRRPGKLVEIVPVVLTHEQRLGSVNTKK